MTRRNWKERLVSQQEYQQARTKYFQQIKLEKAKCWNSFLENAVGKEIFKVFNYIKFNRVEKLSIINLIFIFKSLNKLHIFWEISEQDSGSDHIIIQFTIYIDNKNLVENPLYNN